MEWKVCAKSEHCASFGVSASFNEEDYSIKHARKVKVSCFKYTLNMCLYCMSTHRSIRARDSYYVMENPEYYTIAIGNVIA